jgi:transcriptional regulator NrdR family protein
MSVAESETKGLFCRNCHCRDLRVVRTRPAMNGKIMRIRECRNCERRLISYEAEAGSPVPEVADLSDLSPEQKESLRVRILRLIGFM